MFKFAKVYFANCVFVANSPKFAPTKVSLYTVGKTLYKISGGVTFLKLDESIRLIFVNPVTYGDHIATYGVIILYSYYLHICNTDGTYYEWYTCTAGQCIEQTVYNVSL